MIKVQPARSRVEKTETTDRVLLTSPPKGLFSLGGFVLFISLLWIGLCVRGIVFAWGRSSREWAVMAAAILVPGIALFLVGLWRIRNTWSLERNAETLIYIRSGLTGTRVRSWNARDVSSFWVEAAKAGREQRFILVVGFRNGRNEDIRGGADGEELWWLAAMVMDPRGGRRTAEQPAQAAEPVRKRYDDSVVPSTLTCSKLDSGVELRLQPLIENRRTWFRVFGVPVICFLSAVVAYGVVYGIFYQVTLLRIADGVFPGLMLAALLLLAFRLWVHTRAAEIFVQGGTLRIRQNHGDGSHELKVEDIEFIQTFGKGGDAELQFLVRGQPKIRLFDGRPSVELEWVARFLRVALKGRTEPEATPLRMDATAGDCQVCGERMQDRVVYCAKCRTPHHEECWSYVGTCSTYGCREIRFTRT